MGLRKKVVKGYVNAELRKEKNLVLRLLRTGRMSREEWSDIVEEYEGAVGEYRDGEITPEEFLGKRDRIEEELNCPREEGKNGITRNEALEMYDESRPGYEKALEDACINTPRSTLRYVITLPLVKAEHFWSELKFS